MSRKKGGAPFSLFAFQDAITSVCGVVVLVTLMLALALTQRVVTESESSTVAKSKVDEVRAQVEKLQNDLEELNARVETINALSAHADRNGLMDFFDGVKGSVKRAFAVHGEPEKVAAMVDELKAHGAPSAVAPVPGQSFTFD